MTGDDPRRFPAIGLGTWKNDDPEQCATSVATALKLGYHHVDTAQAYGNEEAVGEGLARADVDREAFQIATKVHNSNLAHDDVIESAGASAGRLGVDTIDLLYVHWPRGEYDPADTMPAFDALRDDGTIEYVGVSNFEPETIAAAQKHLDAPIAANQVELHPYLQQSALRSVCAEEDIAVVAYSPLARGEVFDDPVLDDIAEARDASIAQVVLAWLCDIGVTPIPKATGEAHIRDNLAALDLELTAADHERIEALDRGHRLVDPDSAPWNA